MLARYEKEVPAEITNMLGLRPEALSVEDFILLTKSLFLKI